MSVFMSKQLKVPTFGKPLSDFAVGESAFLNFNGTPTEFLVVQQGLPSSDYDSSCDGTWLLMKDIYVMKQWHSARNNNYSLSTNHTYICAFHGLFDNNIQNLIKQVKIPYHQGTGSAGSVVSGANGLSTKVFLLSATEVGYSGTYAKNEGAILSYFNGATNSERVAIFNGSANTWWLRSPRTNNVYDAWCVSHSGEISYNEVTSACGIRPCIILPYDTLFDPETNGVMA